MFIFLPLLIKKESLQPSEQESMHFYYETLSTVVDLLIN